MSRPHDDELPFAQLGDPLYSQRNPHQLFLLTLSILAAVQLLSGSTGTPVLDAALSDAAVQLWGGGLLVGSVLTLAGMWLPRTWTSLVVERAGLTCVTAAAALYAWVVWTAAPDVAYTVAVHTAYAASCAWRVIQITRRLRWVKQAVQLTNQDPR